MAENNESWKEQRFVYELLKQKQVFRSWKKEQFSCQVGKCAYCKKPMQYRYTETDHFVSLYKGGTSESRNMVLAHHSCNKYKGTKKYYNDLSWIRFNKFGKSVDEKYQMLLIENGIMQPGTSNTANNRPAINKNYHNTTSTTKPKEYPRYKKQSKHKKFMFSLILILLQVGFVLLVALGFILLPKIYKNSTTKTETDINSTLTDDDRIAYTEKSILAYIEWKNVAKTNPSTFKETKCGEGYLGSEKLANRLTCEHKITYAINYFRDMMDSSNIVIKQTNESPNATVTNIALYKIAKCAVKPTSPDGAVLLTHSPYVPELNKTGSYDDVAAVIRLSDGNYYCTDNN